MVTSLGCVRISDHSGSGGSNRVGEKVQRDIFVACNNTLGNDVESASLMAAGDQSGKATALAQVVTRYSPACRKGDDLNASPMNLT